MFQRSYIRSISTIRAAAATATPTTTTTPSDTNRQSSHNNKGLSNVAAQQLARSTKSHIQLKSPFCRIVIAISTLRQTISATAASASSYSLISLLKLLLFYCYYLVAVASFLMIIIYINYSLSQQRSDNETLMLKTQAAIITNRLDRDGRNIKNSSTTRHNRVSRSIPEVAATNAVSQPLVGVAIIQPLVDLLAPETISHSGSNTYVSGSNSSFIIPMMMIEQRSSETRTFESHRTHLRQPQPLHPPSMTQQQSQQSTNRKKLATPNIVQPDNQVARGYSVNNRGTMASATSSPKLQVSTGDNQGQWIPIVSTRAVPDSSSSHYGLPDQKRLTAPISQNNDNPTTGATMQVPVVEAILPPLSLISEESGRLRHPIQSHHLYRHQQNHFESHHHHKNYPNVQMDSHPSYIRHWRRPRFNLNYDVPQHFDKIYKVVLLCEKTLVSLDYMKRIFIEPPAHHHDGSNGDHDFDENDIDLGSNLDPIFAAAAAGRRQASAINNVSSLSTSAEPIEALASGESGVLDNAKSDTVKRSHLLSEEDPLVKCDMWDLEKGLKNRKPPREILAMALRADFDTVRDAINRCRQLSERMLPPDDEYRGGIEIMSTEDLISVFSMKRGLIPGTKWCGLGDMASSYNDLGPKHRIDICCRAHDHCPIRLKPFRNDYGILNIALYTKSHCDCDADFYRCLREVHSRTADMLGNLYFNVMKLQCMREERMKICREMKPIALGFERCVSYVESPMRTVFKFTTPPVAY